MEILTTIVICVIVALLIFVIAYCTEYYPRQTLKKWSEDLSEGTVIFDDLGSPYSRDLAVYCVLESKMAHFSDTVYLNCYKCTAVRMEDNSINITFAYRESIQLRYDDYKRLDVIEDQTFMATKSKEGEIQITLMKK